MIVFQNDLCLIVVSTETVHLGRVVKVNKEQIGILSAKSLDNGRTYKVAEGFMTLSKVDPEKAIAAGVVRFRNVEHARSHLIKFRESDQ